MTIPNAPQPATPQKRQFSSDFPQPYAPMPYPVPLNSPCPVIINAQKVVSTVSDLRKAIARLKRSLSKCHTCQQYPEGCLLIQDMNRQINLAILEVEQEFNLTNG